MILSYLEEELTNYKIKKIDETEYKNVHRLQKTNPYYFSYIQDNPVSFEEVVADILELPHGTTYEQKFYLGFFKDDVLELVMDYIEAYPVEKIVWIGFFMIDGSRKKQGLGKKVMTAFERAAHRDNFERIRLGCVSGNMESYPFWTALGFHEINRVVTEKEGRWERSIIVMEKGIGMNSRISKLKPEEAEEYLEYLKKIGGESDNLSFGSEGLPISVEEEQIYLRENFTTDKSVIYVWKQEGEIIGCSSFSSLPRRCAHRGEVSISVRKAYWNQGIGSELLKAAISFAQEIAKAEVISLEVITVNESAIALYKKFGFEEIGLYKKFFKINETYYDAYLMNLYLHELSA